MMRIFEFDTARFESTMPHPATAGDAASWHEADVPRRATQVRLSRLSKNADNVGGLRLLTQSGYGSPTCLDARKPETHLFSTEACSMAP